MSTTNDITGDRLTTGSSTDAYRDNWDRIYGGKKEAKGEEMNTKELIERLRDAKFPFHAEPLIYDAANALEAQAQEIDDRKKSVLFWTKEHNAAAAERDTLRASHDKWVELCGLWKERAEKAEAELYTTENKWIQGVGKISALKQDKLDLEQKLTESEECIQGMVLVPPHRYEELEQAEAKLAQLGKQTPVAYRMAQEGRFGFTTTSLERVKAAEEEGWWLEQELFAAPVPAQMPTCYGWRNTEGEIAGVSKFRNDFYTIPMVEVNE